MRGVFPILPNGINHLLRLSCSLGPSGHVHHHHKEGITCRQIYTHKHKDSQTQRQKTHGRKDTKTQGHTHIALARLAMCITNTSTGGRKWTHIQTKRNKHKETQTQRDIHTQQGKQTHTLKIEWEAICATNTEGSWRCKQRHAVGNTCNIQKDTRTKYTQTQTGLSSRGWSSNMDSWPQQGKSGGIRGAVKNVLADFAR